MQADLSTILQQLRCYLPKGQPRRLVERCSYSNRVTEVWFDNRRVLIIKSACYPDLKLGLGCERAAAQLLKGSTIAAPQYLPGGAVGSAPPYLAYWRIP